jgi:hypothetical protein
MSERPIPEPSELIYSPASSWGPALIALGLALVLAGMVSFWVWSAVGVLVTLLGARAWWNLADDEISRMRRDQRPETAVIPATPVRGSRDGS